ncbi:uncharacterized protein LOC129246392 [Anastrepha obliqua]|uniref:uncharacterized protein LOC129246392 n=1 Tax=Anastrepha obliqua TaxID=95512 RepID=UPI0024091676|nr:uncharacterized protein LOC129246392 [Anastrepha obliqua]
MTVVQCLKYLVILLVLALKPNSINSSILSAAENDAVNEELLKLLEMVREERDYNTIAIGQSSKENCVFENLLQEISLPVVLLNKRLEYQYNTQFSKELLILLCLKQRGVAATFAELNVFRGLKQTRILVYVPHATNLELIKQYCNDAMANDIYNVLIIQNDFTETHNYHTCNRFPLEAPPYKEKSLHSTELTSNFIFEQQFRDMHGAPIRTYPDQLEPRTMLYYKDNGDLELEGYIGRLLKVFAAKRNATLTIEYPLEVGKTTFYGVLMELAQNGSLDIAAGLVYPQSNNDLEAMSYPVETLDYCYMVPLPETVPINELFVGIIRLPTLFYIFVFIVIFAALFTHLNTRMQLSFINLFLNDKSIRGMLGQSFVIAAKPSLRVKFVIFLLCYMSIITNTTYQAYLQSFLTRPPLLPMYRSYEDIEAAGLRISFPAHEIAVLSANQSLAEHMHLTEIVADFNVWLRLRSSMNTKYVYPVSSVRWDIFNFLQSLFARPIYYFNTDLCFFKNTFLCMPTRADLPYVDLLDDFILRLHSSGIMKEWVSLNFFVMAKLKMLVFEDLSKPIEYGRPLVVDDFFWIQIQYLGCMVLGLVAFVGEILYFRWKKV